MMMKQLISVLVIALSVVSLMGLNGCDRQVPPPKAVQERPQVPETAVGEMAGSALEKAKGVETTLGDAANRTAATGTAGAP